MGEAKTKSVLRQVGTATIDASAAAFDPGVLVTRSGLYVWDGFIDRVRKHAEPVESMGALALPYSDLVEDANDARIVASLGDKSEFSPTEVCYAIEALTKRQPTGEEGDLLNNGYANLFYVVGGPVVRVDWLAGRREWFVDDWPRDGYHWYRGVRAFSRN